MLRITVKVTDEEAAKMVAMPLSTLQRWKKTKPELYRAVIESCLRKRFEEALQ